MNDTGRYRVIVAEDEPRTLANVAMKVALADRRFSVVAKAENGREALRLVRELKPDLLITDIVMPMMDGLDLIAALRKDGSTIPVVILSGYGEFEYAKKAITLGVEDYLLKPLEVQALKDLLSRLRARLETAESESERAMLDACVRQGADLPSGTVGPSGSKYLLLVVAIGNLLDQGELLPAEQSLHYHRFWQAIDPTPIYRDRGGDGRHLLIDAGVQNQRIIAFAGSFVSTVRPRDLADRVLGLALPLASPYPVNLAIGAEAVPFTRVRETALGLTEALCSAAVAGTSSVVIPRSTIPASSSPDPLPPGFEVRLRALFESGSREGIESEIRTLLAAWYGSPRSQRLLEVGLERLVQALERSQPVLGTLDGLRCGIRRVIASGKGYAELHAALEHTIATAVRSLPSRLDGRRIAECVTEYLSRNYAQSVSLGSLSRRLGYDVSYVARVFKRYTGVSPVKHLIRLRIEEANRLFTRSPELDVKTVGKMVGYADQRYFCRIFKRMTGVSPSEFRRDH